MSYAFTSGPYRRLLRLGPYPMRAEWSCWFGIQAARWEPAARVADRAAVTTLAGAAQ